ncbi:unnamed protein product [Phaedon cochleariae]|uniref:Uncharacterized protein n=1 Tax=Phaedon cochleariae TaxID=80249 RepID=A0A9N9X0N8_PHACE|nr:unnamed protein product [Phaedon cochleariae]
MYLVKKDTAFYASLKTLRFFFVYPELKENSTFNVAPYMSFILSSLVFVIFIFGSSIHVVMSIRANIGGDISEDLSVILGGLGMMTNVGMFQHYQGRWSKFFTDVTNFEAFGKPTDFDRTRERGNLFATG